MGANNSFGMMFYSKFFESRCVVVAYYSDTDWRFVVEDQPTNILKARTNIKEFKEEEN